MQNCSFRFNKSIVTATNANTSVLYSQPSPPLSAVYRELLLHAGLFSLLSEGLSTVCWKPHLCCRIQTGSFVLISVVCVKAVVFRAHLEAVYTNLTLKNQSSLMPVIVITDTSARQPLKGFAAASRVYKCCLNKPQDFGIGEQR